MRVSSSSNTYLAESADCDEDDAERRERDHGVLGRAANHDAIATESECTRTTPYVIFRAHTHEANHTCPNLRLCRANHGSTSSTNLLRLHNFIRFIHGVDRMQSIDIACSHAARV